VHNAEQVVAILCALKIHKNHLMVSARAGGVKSDNTRDGKYISVISCEQGCKFI
jgi:hypothetical protein